MEIRVLDEAIALDRSGLALVVASGDTAALSNGCRIRDVRGNVHTVSQVSIQEELLILLLPDGNADYFGRLFRNVLVDGTCFALVQEEH